MPLMTSATMKPIHNDCKVSSVGLTSWLVHICIRKDTLATVACFGLQLRFGLRPLLVVLLSPSPRAMDTSLVSRLLSFWSTPLPFVVALLSSAWHCCKTVPATSDNSNILPHVVVLLSPSLNTMDLVSHDATLESPSPAGVMSAHLLGWERALA